MSDHLQLNEAETRYNLIDPLLVKAGWDLANRRSVGFEIPVDGYDAAPINGITDYCLYRDNGEVLAVVEAKRTRRDAREGPVRRTLYKFCINSVEKLCCEDEVEEILELTKKLIA